MSKTTTAAGGAMLPRQHDYLTWENNRNARNAKLYTDIINVAFGKVDVIVGHHLTFEQHGNIKTENEVPSADTLLFDTNVAQRVFGEHWKAMLHELALTPCEARDAMYAVEFYAMHPHLRKKAA